MEIQSPKCKICKNRTCYQDPKTKMFKETCGNYCRSIWCQQQTKKSREMDADYDKWWNEWNENRNRHLKQRQEGTHIDHAGVDYVSIDADFRQYMRNHY